jgi:hypothetical protein
MVQRLNERGEEGLLFASSADRFIPHCLNLCLLRTKKALVGRRAALLVTWRFVKSLLKIVTELSVEVPQMAGDW